MAPLPRLVRSSLSIVLFAALALPLALAAEPKAALRVLASYDVPGAPSTPTDVRWASQRSIYLSRFHDGVTEVALGPVLETRRVLVPERRALSSGPPFAYLNFTKLAVSPEAVAFAANVQYLAWRPMARSHDGLFTIERERVDATVDLDLHGDQVLILGALDYSPSPAGYVVSWLGSVHDLDHLKPVLYDGRSRGVAILDSCGGHELGAARFLADGSFLVVPGFQPGAHLFSPEGKLLHTWDTRLLGLDVDADCAAMTKERRQRIALDLEYRHAWLNRHRIVEDILPLRGGPALVVRSVAGGKVEWELLVLGRERVQRFVVPIEASSPHDRLRGDVQGDRIALLASDRSYIPGVTPKKVGKLILAELPTP